MDEPRVAKVSDVSPVTARPVTVVIGVALLLRVVWALLVPVHPVSDSNAYDVFAQTLAAGGGYGWEAGRPDAFWPVGIPFVYSLFYRVFGHSYLPIVIFNIAVSLGTIYYVYRIGVAWFGSKIGFLGAGFLAVWPCYIEFVTVLQSELTYAFLTVFLAHLSFDKRFASPKWDVVLGVISAAACFVRPTGLLVPIVYGMSRFAQREKLQRIVVSLAIQYLVMAALITPWTIRNYKAFDRFVLISANSGSNLWMGNNPKSTGGYSHLPKETEGMSVADRDAYLKEKAVRYIKENPGAFVVSLFKKTWITHSRESIGVTWNQAGLESRYPKGVISAVWIASNGFWVVVCLLGAAGILIHMRRTGVFALVSSPAILMWAYYASVHAVIVGQDRYHIPSNPFIALLAAVALDAALERWKSKEAK